jgi:hypothetical protein
LQYYVRIPFRTGSPHIFENLTVNISGTLAFTAGTCKVIGTPAKASCYRFVAVYLYGYSFLIDNTTGTRTPPKTSWPGSLNYSENVTSCISGVCNSAASLAAGLVSVSVALSFLFYPGKMVKTDHYVLQLYLYGGSEVDFSTQKMTISGASGAASMNFATRGNGVVLTSIQEV